LDRQEASGSPVSALLLNEPIFGSLELPPAPEGYVYAPKNPKPGDGYYNPHLEVGVLYKIRDELATVAPVSTPASTFHGFSLVEMSASLGESALPSIMVATLYLPNGTSPEAVVYKAKLIKQTVDALIPYKQAGHPIIIGMDSNCPYYTRHGRAPSSGNTTLLREVMEKLGLVRFNWEQNCTGFFTRSTSHQRASQLDVFLVSNFFRPHIHHMEISPTVHLGGDHFMLDLYIRARARPLAQECTREFLRYDWTSVAQSTYLQGLPSVLAEFNAQAADLLAHPERIDQNTATQATSIFTAAVLSHAQATVNPTRVRIGVSRPARPIGTANALYHCIHERGKAKTAMLMGKKDLEEGKITEAAYTALVSAFEQLKQEVITRLQSAAREKQAPQWADMGAVFDTDKKAFYNKFGKLYVKEPRVALPRTLIVNQNEVTKQAAIKRAWKRRFYQPPYRRPEAAAAHQAHHKFVREKVLEFSSAREFEDLPFNQNPTSADIKAALKDCDLGTEVGDDGIQNEMLKFGGEPMKAALLLLFSLLWVAERVAQEWKVTRIDPLYKHKGDIHSPENYRPIGKNSNLFKLYERVLKIKLARVIPLPPEQCGFRKYFGTTISLLRLKIVMAYCKYHGLELHLISLDFKEAFERVWREGLLYLLWEAGVKGKLWRIVRDLLTGTSAYVRTNMGDTTRFEHEMGVIMGSVLGPVLFSVYINTLVDELKDSSPILNDTALRPGLFADDALLLALSLLQKRRAYTAASTWALRWQATLNARKTQCLSTNPQAGPFEMAGEWFEEKSSALILGVRVARTALLSTAHLGGLVKRYLSRMLNLHAAGVHNDGLTIPMAFELYQSLAHSLLLYTLPLHDPNSPLTGHLQRLDTHSLCAIYGLPKTTPFEVVAAESGVLAMEVLANIALLMLLHRVCNNLQDPLTRSLIQWTCFTDNNQPVSMLARATRVLHSFHPNTRWWTFVQTKYDLAKQQLQEVALVRSKREWPFFLQSYALTRQNTYTSVKQKWGPDPLLLQHRPHTVGLYLRVRYGCQSLHRDETGACLYCPEILPTTDHQLWVCPFWAFCREKFLQETRPLLPEPDYLRALAPNDRSAFVLGAGAKILSPSKWALVLPHCLTLVAGCCSRPDPPVGPPPI
jgi:hypothetical protein